MLQKTNAVAVRTIGIDTGKNTFHLIGLDQQGTIVLREKLARGRIGRRLANASPCLIGIEAGMATGTCRPKQSCRLLAFCRRAYPRAPGKTLPPCWTGRAALAGNPQFLRRRSDHVLSLLAICATWRP